MLRDEVVGLGEAGDEAGDAGDELVEGEVAEGEVEGGLGEPGEVEIARGGVVGVGGTDGASEGEAGELLGVGGAVVGLGNHEAGAGVGEEVLGVLGEPAGEEDEAGEVGLGSIEDHGDERLAVAEGAEGGDPAVADEPGEVEEDGVVHGRGLRGEDGGGG